MKDNEQAKKAEPRLAKVWRAIGVLITLAAPPLLVHLSAPAVQLAVEKALKVSFSPLLSKARGDDALTGYIKAQIESAAIDRTLIIYLGIAALVGLIGAVHRVWAHAGESDSIKAADFAGKCLALSAAMLALSGAELRFGGANVLPYLPTNFAFLSTLVGVMVIAALWLCGYLAGEAKKDCAKNAPCPRHHPCEAAETRDLA